MVAGDARPGLIDAPKQGGHYAFARAVAGPVAAADPRDITPRGCATSRPGFSAASRTG
jgi:hypothetical protein